MTTVAARRALEVLLAEQGTSFEPTATLNAIVGVGKSLDRDGFVQYLSNALRVDVQTVRTLGCWRVSWPRISSVMSMGHA